VLSHRPRCLVQYCHRSTPLLAHAVPPLRLLSSRPPPFSLPRVRRLSPGGLTIRSSSRPPPSRIHGPPLPHLSFSRAALGRPFHYGSQGRLAAAQSSLPFRAGTARLGLVAAAAAA
jgi:hypothetical protein